MSQFAPHALRHEQAFAQKSIRSDAQTLPLESAAAQLPVPVTARPQFFPSLILAMVAGFSLLISLILLISRQSSPTLPQRKLAAWAQACSLGDEPDLSLQASAEDNTYSGSVPGNGKFRAAYELDTAGVITVADLVLAVDRPQWGCLDYGLLRRDPVMWARMVLAGGKIEAYALLPARAERLTPDTPIYALYCYASGEDYPLSQVGPWRGFSSTGAYQDCLYGGTATPR